jgi:large subunit ribosomal protein L21
MYAVISTGGKQYRLEQGDLIKVESLEGAVGDKVVFDEVLAVGDEKSTNIGAPVIAGAEVSGTIVEHGKGAKVTVLKFKRRKMYRKKTGHRQQFTAVKIESIVSGSQPEKKQTTTRKRKPAAAKSEKKASKGSTGSAKKAAVAAKKSKPTTGKSAKDSAAKKTTSKTKSEATKPQE